MILLKQLEHDYVGRSHNPRLREETTYWNALESRSTPTKDQYPGTLDVARLCGNAPNAELVKWPSLLAQNSAAPTKVSTQ
ncbi:hypothetical protein CLCR_09363 [Cladophialophora carrionii]|uniref:Uncharacterized protein n=1 Tax=Cladophialophora carrionii TaxID=86049 RepID=A0A1C1CTR3_9EURO|nr:hypothetical protein CLCR_09363 [Cladophialophora carrionii]